MFYTHAHWQKNNLAQYIYVYQVMVHTGKTRFENQKEESLSSFKYL